MTLVDLASLCLLNSDGLAMIDRELFIEYNMNITKKKYGYINKVTVVK